MIPPAFTQDLLARTDIVEVIGRHVELKRSGANLVGLCPFHAEKSPSFSVSPGKNLYHCFGCGAGGDAVRFLMEHQGLSFVEAVRDLAQRVGMQVPEEQVSPEERQRRDTLRQRRQTIGEVLAKAAAFYRAELKNAPRAVGYLKRRGLSGAIAARFGLGYAPPGWRTLAGVFGRYDDPALEEAGLVRVKEAARDAGQGDDPDAPAAPGDAPLEHGEGATAAGAPPEPDDRGRYDWFRDRIMFPIRGVGGEIIGFGGRVLDDSKPKYMNSPETAVFSKGRELYGLFEARQALREKGYALVVEGYMDVVALAQHGFANAVATLGTACTADHVMKLFRFTDSVVFSFDGDAAGRRAAARALEAALPHAGDLRTVRFLFLPPEHDPDSFVRELGPEAFEAEVAKAVPLSRQLIDQAADGQNLDSAEGRARLLAQARPLWSALPDGMLKAQVLAELAAAARLAGDDLASMWNVRRASSGRHRPAWQGRAFGAAGGGGGGSTNRRAPAAPAAVAARMLLLHADWWERLSSEDHQLLHEVGGRAGDVVAWLDRRIVEHGAETWAALAEAAADEPWAADARAWVEAAAPEEQQTFEHLETIVHRLWIERLESESNRLAREAAGDPSLMSSYREVLRRIQHHRSAIAHAAAPPP